jgi:ABC-2 type transport system permease protein
MSTSTAASAQEATGTASLKRLRWPRSRLAHFVARRGLKASIGWALLFGGFTLINAVGYETAYGTAAAREQLAASLGSNVGLQMLLGDPFRIDLVTGFTEWRALGSIGLIGSIWALLYATRTFRGEETAGRWELFLAGQTTARRAAFNALLGMGRNLLIMFVIISVLVAGVTRSLQPDFPLAGSLSYSLIIIAIMTVFMAVGAFASQLFSTRGQAAALSAMVFGVCFLLRGIADSSNIGWLLNLTPFGWLEKIRPLTDNNLIWFLPVLGLVILLVLATVYVAGCRDMGSSLVTDRDTAKPHLGLLNSPVAMAFRLTRATTFGWLTGIAFVGMLLGSFAKSAGQTLAASQTAEQIFTRLTSSAEIFGALTFLGMALFMCMMLIMLYVAGAVSTVRNDEAEGFLDNLLVRPISRSSWLWGRIALIVGGVVAAGLLAGAGAWLGAALQDSGVGYGDLFVASINAMAPALFVLGLGMTAFGYAPRFAATAAYGVVAWSFILQMIGSILNLNHWLLDLSILHHVALAPTVDPNWASAGLLAGLGLAGCIIGVLRFRQRDLQNE